MLRLLAVFAFLIAPLCAAAEKHALVIGNGNYRDMTRLSNAPNDATDLTQALHGLGFRVMWGVDLDRATLMNAVQTFAQGLRRGDTALFFFAGHGMQIGSDNYILPVDADSTTQESLQATSVRLQSVLASLEDRASVRIVILDACRNEPLPPSATTGRSAGESRGFMKMDAGVGSFIAFSTAPGSVASDGNGRNSPFTGALLAHLAQPGENIHAVMRRVRADVMTATANRQIPWENSALIDEVFLSAPPPVVQLSPYVPPAPSAPALPQQPMSRSGSSCDQLWYRRNAIFAANGYCFQTARGQAAFSNANCRAGLSAAQIPLSAADRAEVAAILAQEQAAGCR